MLEAFTTKHNRIISFICLAACGLLGAAAAAVGINDNLPGILLVYLAVIAFLLAFTHPWRAARQYRNLIFASVAGFIVFTVLHNLLDAAAVNLGAPALVVGLLDILGTGCFLIAVLLCPAALAVGAAGAAVLYIRERRSRRGATAA